MVIAIIWRAEIGIGKAGFSWVCLGPWEQRTSSRHNCNRYAEERAKAARVAQKTSRAALLKYLFYYNRYTNHMQSLKSKHKLYKMRQFNSRNGPVKAKFALAAAVAFDTAGNIPENRFPEYLAVTLSRCFGCQECQHISVPSGHFSI
jgi:hypothetical protein